jgi:hypothetical protein
MSISSESGALENIAQNVNDPLQIPMRKRSAEQCRDQRG